jgi:transcriptional regulator with XRE-family HTH domain
MAFVNKIQEFLKQKSIDDKAKRKEFIEGSRIHKSTVSKIINASHQSPDLKTILKIADYFNCTIDEVLDRTNNLSKKANISKLPLNELNNNLRNFIKGKLEKHLLTPYQLSRNCGFSSDAIRHFIRETNARETLGIMVIVALADYFKISIDEMIGRIPPSDQKPRLLEKD